MEIECFGCLDEELAKEWKDFLDASVHQHPRQDPRFADVERAVGNDVVFAVGRVKREIRAVGIFSLKPSQYFGGRTAIASALSGPICDGEDEMVDFMSGVVTHPMFGKVNAVSLTPYWIGDECAPLASALAGLGFKITDPESHRNTGLIYLDQSEDELRASFSRSARRKVRLIEKSDAVIQEVTTRERAEEFFERLNTLVIAPHNLTPVGPREVDAGINHIFLNPSIGVILAAYHDGAFLGGLLLYRSGKTAHARRYVADPAAVKPIGNLRVAPALWLEGLFWAKRQGCEQFDVEGFLPVEDKSHPNFNVYEYKRELKPNYVMRMAEHTLILNKIYHRLECLPAQIKSVLKSILPHALQTRIRAVLSDRKRRGTA